MRRIAFPAALAAALGASVAQADFRWVDPVPVIVNERGGPGPVVRPPAGIAVPPAAMTPPSGPGAIAEPDMPYWDVRPGEMLGDTLRRWGARVGVEVHVLTDRRYRMDGSRRFLGSFSDVVEALLDSLSWLPNPPQADITDQNVLLIRHVSPATAGPAWKSVSN